MVLDKDKVAELLCTPGYTVHRIAREYGVPVSEVRELFHAAALDAERRLYGYP